MTIVLPYWFYYLISACAIVYSVSSAVESVIAIRKMRLERKLLKERAKLQHLELIARKNMRERKRLNLTKIKRPTEGTRVFKEG